MSVRGYIKGYVLSLCFTLAAYFIASKQVSHGWALIFTLTVLAISQLVTQLVFFLHLKEEPSPRWNLQALLFAVMVVVILVFGSLWIMKNLNYAHNHIAPANESNQSIIKDEGY